MQYYIGAGIIIIALLVLRPQFYFQDGSLFIYYGPAKDRKFIQIKIHQ